MSDAKFSALMGALVCIAFVGGCTYTIANSDGIPVTKIIKACLDTQGYTWENDRCEKLPQ